MIYTVTLNPSLDYIVRVNDFQIGATNRTTYEKMLGGGKGINVSIVLKHLGYESTALGFTAGFTGEELKRLVRSYGVNAQFLDVEEGMTRINVKLKAQEETEINGMGPLVKPQNIAKLTAVLKQLCEGDVLVLSGSVPKGVPVGIYEEILALLKDNGVKTVVDATGSLLRSVLPYHPFLIKPNHNELGDLFGVELKTREDVIPYARKLQEEGARNVLVSMAGEGAVLVSETGEVIQGDAPEGTVVNSVGAGDSMVAGFLAGYLSTDDYRAAFELGICTGSASAFSEELACRDAVVKLLEQYHSR